MLNPFDNDVFTMAALTAAINKIPNTYGRLEQLNLFPSAGVRTRTIVIEEMNGVLNLLPTRPVGAPGSYALLFVRAAAFSELPARGDEVTVGSSVYKVVDLEADSEGGLRLVLHFNRAV